MMSQAGSAMWEIETAVTLSSTIEVPLKVFLVLESYLTEAAPVTAILLVRMLTKMRQHFVSRVTEVLET